MNIADIKVGHKYHVLEYGVVVVEDVFFDSDWQQHHIQARPEASGRLTSFVLEEILAEVE